MIVKWNNTFKTYNCFVKLSKENDSSSLFTVDTGASFTTLGSKVLYSAGLLSSQDEDGINNFFYYAKRKPMQFVNASNEPNYRYLCCLNDIEVVGIKFKNFYFFLDPKPTDIALIGNDILHNCKFGSTDLGNMVIKDLDYIKYINTIKEAINTEGITPYYILNTLTLSLDKQQEDIRNTASSFRELYKIRKDD